MNFQENENYDTDGNVSDANTGTVVRWHRVVSPKGWTTDMRRYYNKPCKRQRYFDWKKVLTAIRSDRRIRPRWQILHEDVFPISFMSLRCRICRQTDHLEKSCPRRKAKCTMCGIPGHTEYRCPQRMCLNCGERNEDFVDICRKCRSLKKTKCTRCKRAGHASQNCPDLWRRYHCTTEYKEINTTSVERNKNIQCCNCAQLGHFFEDCKKSYWTSYLPVSNTVTDYTDHDVKSSSGTSSSSSSTCNNWTEFKLQEKIPSKRPRLEINLTEDVANENPTSTQRTELNSEIQNITDSRVRKMYDKIRNKNPLVLFEMMMKKKKKRKKKKKKKKDEENPK